MGKFHSTFYSLGSKQDFSPDAWKSAFVSANASQWGKDEGGSIQYFCDGGEQYSLVMNFKSGIGISFSYDRYNKDDFSRNFSMISQAGAEPLIGFECLENGAMVPIGSCLALEKAWAVVESFLVAPCDMPGSVHWVNANDLDWPEEY